MLEQIVTPLLSWYDKHARVLPWREDTAAYRVWVSEIMLQQTRVEAVKPFFERFIKALPDVQALSEAPGPQHAEGSQGDRVRIWRRFSGGL